jgi:hypothetical protein
MPNVDGKKFPYTPEGKKKAVAAAKASNKTAQAKGQKTRMSLPGPMRNTGY